MPRAKAAKLYKNFTKGLITEAGFLTYPENASTDELNTVIKIKGSRSRRLGLDFEPTFTAASVAVLDNSDVLSEFVWRGANNDADTNFLVVKVNDLLYFFDLDEVPIAGAQKSFTLDLTPYLAPAATQAELEASPVQMAAGKGYLFVTSEAMDPILIEYDPDTDTITTIKLLITLRDFEGVDDGLSNEDQPATLTKEHLYNLRNQGWVKPGNTSVGTSPSGGDPFSPPAGPSTSTPSYPNYGTGTINTNIP